MIRRYKSVQNKRVSVDQFVHSNDTLMDCNTKAKEPTSFNNITMKELTNKIKSHKPQSTKIKELTNTNNITLKENTNKMKSTNPKAPKPTCRPTQ